MKLTLRLSIFLISINVCFAQYDHQNINLLGRYFDSTVVAEPQYGIKYQACWGWADSIGREFGIIGSTAGTYFVDVTNPSNPVFCDYVSHHQVDLIWHEYKTYGNLLYIISDNGGTGFQIVDLSYLPDSVHVIYDDMGLFEHAHTISLDGNKMYLGSVGSNFQFSSMAVYSLNYPGVPFRLRGLEDDFPFISSVHDMFVVNDTIYASCGFDGLFIFKYDSVQNLFQQISSLQDNTNIYNHSSVLSPDHKYLYLCEEIPDGQPVKVIDLHDIYNPFVDTTFVSNVGDTPHNPSVLNNNLVLANYQDGVYIYNISNPAVPTLNGFFDTYPANTPGTYNLPAYAGCWSTYNDLPSGILLAGDMQSGLFVLDISDANAVNEIKKDNILVYPNPAHDRLTIKNSPNSLFYIYDCMGRNVMSSKTTQETSTVDISSLPKGIYYVSIVNKNKTTNQKFIRQ